MNSDPSFVRNTFFSALKLFAPLTNSLGWAFLGRADAQGAADLSAANLFDRDWYLKAHPNVAARGADPLLHFARNARRWSLDPTPLFDSAWYVRQYPDVAAGHWIPALHYLRQGAAEDRNPNPLFDTAWYREKYPEVTASGLNPLRYFIERGGREGHKPSRFFDTKRYLKSRSAVARAGENPLAHYFENSRQAPQPRTEATAVTAERLSRLRELTAANPSPYYARLAEMLAAHGIARFEREIDRLMQFDSDRSATTVAKGPLVSVVMSVWSHGDAADEAIESVLAQTHSNFELLICDDASDGESPAAIHEYRDIRVKIVRRGKDRGMAATRNISLAAAKGSYIAYLDAANLWHPRFLESAVGLLEKNAAAFSCYANAFELDIDANGLAIRDGRTKPFDFDELVRERSIDLNSFVHRSDAARALGPFMRGLPRREDHEYLIRHTWLRDPVRLDVVFNIRRRLPFLGDVAAAASQEEKSAELVKGAVETMARDGVKPHFPGWFRKVSIILSDRSADLPKVDAIAAALGPDIQCEVVSFSAAVTADSGDDRQKDLQLRAADFPEFFGEFAKALNTATDVVYAIGPKLGTLGVALMANYHRGAPIILDVDSAILRQVSIARARPFVLNPANNLIRGPSAQTRADILEAMLPEVPAVLTDDPFAERDFSTKYLPVRTRSSDTQGAVASGLNASMRWFGPKADALYFALACQRTDETKPTYEISRQFANALAEFRRTLERTP